MKHRTVNMFAVTNEDLPLFSGYALTQAAEWNREGTNGICNECSLTIRETVGGEYQAEVYLHDYFTNEHKLISLTYESSFEQAQLVAIEAALSRQPE